MVGISVHLTFARRTFELADWYRRRGAKVVLGGLHVLSCPDECEPHADALAVGEGVQLWPMILADVSAGQLKPRYDGSFLKPYRDDPPPRRSLLRRRSFLTTTSLIATRGCHSRCGFCYLATKGLHMPYQLRDPEQIAAEFAADDQPYGVFIDNNLGSKPDYLLKLCQALKPLNKLWSAAVSIDVTDRPDVVREMALAGCFGVFVGFESLNPGNIADSGKKSPRPDDYARRVKILHDHGIQVNGSFVLGFDHDTPDVFERTVEWIEANRLECATFHILTPYPGTPLFRQMDAEGRLLHKDWSRYDTAHVVFTPKGMTEDELAYGYGWCYQRLFSLRSIWRRRPRDPAAVLPYLAMSLLYKRSNRLWHFLIRHRLTGPVWRPIMRWSRWRHLRFRAKLQRRPALGRHLGPAVVSAGV
ncbi:MAG: radical SAM protein [Tepidisphaeraceae bacterium]